MSVTREIYYDLANDVWRCVTHHPHNGTRHTVIVRMTAVEERGLAAFPSDFFHLAAEALIRAGRVNIIEGRRIIIGSPARCVIDESTVGEDL